MRADLRVVGAIGAAVALGAALSAAPGTASATAQPCRLALILAMDVSASVDAGEYRLMRDGTAAALASDEVAAAILSLGGVHMSVFEWSGRQRQRIVADWSSLGDLAAIARFAGGIADQQRSFHQYPTALGSALGFAQRLMREAPPCDRYVVDIAGDGPNNHGFGPASAYRAFDFSAITVNGLVVTPGIDEAPAGANDAVTYYRDEVRNGPDAFIEVALGYGDFERAMRRKLLREIGVLSLSAAPHPE
ncbi:MAG: DUF1194 domain-containing protein [Pseudomonadota bacterium]